MNKSHTYYKNIQSDQENRFLASTMYYRPRLLEDNPEAITLINMNNTMMDHEEIQILIEGLSNFLKITTQEDIIKYNQERLERNKSKNVQKPEQEVIKKRVPKRGYVYFIKDNNNHCKIGMTKDISKRVGEYTKLPYEPTLVHIIETNDMEELETIFHEKYASKRLRGEWFELNDIDYRYITSKKYLKDTEIRRLVCQQK